MGNLNATLSFLRAFLGTRADRLRCAMHEKDRGASAVELAIITAIILGVAIGLLAVITTFVTNEQSKINAP